MYLIIQLNFLLFVGMPEGTLFALEQIPEKCKPFKATINLAVCAIYLLIFYSLVLIYLRAVCGLLGFLDSLVNLALFVDQVQWTFKEERYKWAH